MRTVSIFRSIRNQAIRLPRDLEFRGVTELEIRRERDAIILRPVRPSWKSEPHADENFLAGREDLIGEGRLSFADDVQSGA
jgi:antitoxin VapB